MTLLVKTMTRLLAFVLLAASTSPNIALAQTATSDAANDAFASIVCPMMGELATVTMRLRQEGNDMSTVIATLTAGQEMPAKGIVKDLIISAYKFPQMSVAENRRKAVVEFSNNAQVDCYTKDWVATGMVSD